MITSGRMIENEQEIGLEISLTTYDEGFEPYQHQSWRHEQEPIVKENNIENETVTEHSTDAAKELQCLPEKPSPSIDSTISVSSLEASLDDQVEGHKIVPTVDLSSLSAVSSTDVFDEEVAVLTSGNSRITHPDLPAHKEEEEEEEEERDLDEQAPDLNDTTFLSRLHKSRAFLEAFPTTVKDLNSKINDLLEALHDKEKRCQAAEAELALVKHEACLHSEEYRILYSRAKEEQVRAAKECKAKAAQIADLQSDRDMLARIMQDPETTRTAQEKEIRRLRDELAASQAETANFEQEKAQQAMEMEKLRASNEKTIQDLQETKRAHQAQLGSRTAALEEERRRNQQLQVAQDALTKQLETLKAEHSQLQLEHDQNLTDMMEQSQTFEELTMEIGEWRVRAEQSAAETTRLSRENASLTAHQDYVTGRAKAEVDQAQTELQYSQAHWEAKLAAALSNNEQIQGQLLFLEKRTKELTVDLQKWKDRANEEEAKVVSLLEKLELREEQLQTARAHTEVLSSKVELLQGARDEISVELEESRYRIKTLEASGRTGVTQTDEVRVAQQESAIVKAMTAKLKDTTKRRRGILTMHRNKSTF